MLKCIFSSSWHGLCLVNSCFDEFCVLSGIGLVCWTQVSITFLSSLTLEGPGQHEMHSVPSQVCERFGNHFLRWRIWSTIVQIHFVTLLVNTCWDAFYRLAGMVSICSTQVDMHFVSTLAFNDFGHTNWDAFRVLAGMGGVCSTHVEMHFMFLQTWVGQHMLRFILSALWHVMDFVSSYWFCVLAGMSWVWSTEVEIHFVSTLAFNDFGHTCWDAFRVLAGMEGVCLMHVEMYFMFLLAWVGQHMFR